MAGGRPDLGEPEQLPVAPDHRLVRVGDPGDAAENELVPIARELLLDRWALPAEAVITKGYCRRD